ncbi:ABC transporter ATP-binding protein [Nonomuraea sp. NPDC000554]|uniref:ABC transporter ATP-binding protein n=1 Tax=Nonomuraea sp. NPDC000554 TaxID=3154259 RepID=UPI0033333A97
MWEADTKGTVGLAVLQLVSAVGLASVLVLVRSSLTALEAAGGSGFRAASIPAALAIVVLGSAAGMVRAVSTRIQRMLTVKVDRHATAIVLRSAVQAELSEFEDSAFHDRLQRAVFASRSRLTMLVTATVAIGQAVLAAVAVAGTFASMAWWLLPVATVSAIPVLKAARDDRNSRHKLHHALSENRRRREYLERLLTGRDEAKEIRSLRLGRVLRDRWDAAYRQEIQGHSAANRRYMWGSLGARAAADVVVLAVVGGGIWLVAVSVIDLATVAAALTGLWFLSTRAQMLGGLLSGIGESILYLEDLRAFTAVPPRETAPPRIAMGTVQADQVSFAYPGTDRPVLRDVTVVVKPGEVIALVGANGSGKTTLAKILAGLYQPDDGSVLLDGTPVTDIRVLRDLSAVVFQDFVRYKLPAIDNVTFGRPEAPVDAERAQRALAQAGADAFVASLPAGAQTILGKEFACGADLSGGQWQRLAIARAFYRDRPFVILDEPTAALDPKAEDDLFARIRNLFANRAVLMISHRFSSVRHADRIYVMEAGRVIEEGTHESLMARHGTYAQLFTIQARSYR